jgi:hypothetical protein
LRERSFPSLSTIMTLAICWQCGARKVGALAACAACGALPVAASDKAKSLLLSDHYREPDELAKAGEQIAGGGSVPFDDAQVEQLAGVVASAPSVPIGCRVAVWIPIVVLVLLVVVVVALFLAGAYSN